MARESHPKAAPETAYEVAVLARSGNEQARRVFETVGRSLAIAHTALVNTLNLPIYLIGGGVSEAWDLFAPTMFTHLRRRSYVYRLTEPQVHLPERLEGNRIYILPAELGSPAGLIGACLFGLESSPRVESAEEISFVHQ
jgi:glucokinase